MKKLLSIFTFCFSYLVGFAQNSEAQEGLSELTTFSTKAYSDTSKMATYFVSAILGLGLIYVIWALATGQEKGSKYLIAWVIAVIFAVMFLNFI